MGWDTKMNKRERMSRAPAFLSLCVPTVNTMTSCFRFLQDRSFLKGAQGLGYPVLFWGTQCGW